MAYSIEKVESSDGFITFMENVIQQLKDSIYTDTMLIKDEVDGYHQVKKIEYVELIGDESRFEITCADGYEVYYLRSNIDKLLDDLVSAEISEAELESMKD